MKSFSYFAAALLAMCLSTAALAAVPALPSGFFLKPYIGADYEYTAVNYKKISGSAYSYGDLFASSFNGGDVHVGARIHRYLGFEAAYFDTLSEDKSHVLGTVAHSSTRIHGESLDAMGYLPIGHSGVELIGTAGVARNNYNSSLTVNGTTYPGNGNNIKFRVGGGAQYWLTDNLNVRGLVRYQDVSGTSISDAIIASLGVNWQF